MTRVGLIAALGGRASHMTMIDLGRPESGDVIDLIIEDHRRFEALLRDLRNAESDRERVRAAFSALHVAHAEAEEKYVYPALRRKSSVDAEEVEHGEEEHAEGNEALLALLECSGTDTQKFDDALENLAELVNHHLTEEELTILNPARDDVAESARMDLGEQVRDGAQPADRRRLRQHRQRPTDRRSRPAPKDSWTTRRSPDPCGRWASRRRCSSSIPAPGSSPRSRTGWSTRPVRRRTTSTRSCFCSSSRSRTRPHTDLAALREDLVAERRLAAESAESIGAALASVGAPVLPHEDGRTTPKQRYVTMLDMFGTVVGQAGLVCGTHVHVHVTDDEAVGIVDDIQPWLPLLAAMSVNSPFYRGVDTGYASWRRQVYEGWPSVGPVEPFGDSAGYQDAVRDLIASGAAMDEGMVYFDARLSRNFPTIEIRVADACTDVDDTVLIAELARALVETVARSRAAGQVAPPWRIELLRAARWRVTSQRSERVTDGSGHARRRAGGEGAGRSCSTACGRSSTITARRRSSRRASADCWSTAPARSTSVRSRRVRPTSGPSSTT